MSLRLQLVALFAAVLAATLLVAAGFGLRIAQRSVETEVRDRTVELARAATAALRRAGTDDEQISEELAATIRMHRGLLRAELARTAAQPASRLGHRRRARAGTRAAMGGAVHRRPGSAGEARPHRLSRRGREAGLGGAAGPARYRGGGRPVPDRRLLDPAGPDPGAPR